MPPLSRGPDANGHAHRPPAGGQVGQPGAVPRPNPRSGSRRAVSGRPRRGGRPQRPRRGPTPRNPAARRDAKPARPARGRGTYPGESPGHDRAYGATARASPAVYTRPGRARESRAARAAEVRNRRGPSRHARTPTQVRPPGARGAANQRHHAQAARPAPPAVDPHWRRPGYRDLGGPAPRHPETIHEEYTEAPRALPR